MNFFAHQEEARRRTLALVALFVLAVVLIILILYAGLTVLFIAQPIRSARAGLGPPALWWWQPKLLACVTLTVLALVGVASLAKTLSLREGGAAVAKMLGGREVAPDTIDPREKRLRNVVEEMALASGTPVPRVYLLDEEGGINAFAAGFSTRDAVVAVTKGTLDRLTRDELQGVVAHEFSHLLNGDSRLNIRLIGVLQGILAIGLIGRAMLRSTGRVRRDSRGAPALLGLGLLLFLVGYIGVFAGRLIKAAVSRQREYLADASAVQFTRNPGGIGGALRKIGGFVLGSSVGASHAEEASHFFFGEGVKVSFLSGLLATHPPLPERIARVEPAFRGVFDVIEADAPPVALEEFEQAGISGLAGREAATLDPAVPEPAVPEPAVPEPASIVDRIGRPTAESLEAAIGVSAAIPDAVLTAVRTPIGAVATVYALLLDAGDAERKRQFDALAREAPDAVAEAARVHDLVRALGEHARLPLLDLAAPALRALSGDDRARLLRGVDALVTEDGALTLFEFAVQQVLAARMRKGKGPDRVAYYSAAPLASDLVVLLAGIAQAGNPDDPKAARDAFLAGWARLPKMGKKPALETLVEKAPLADVARAIARIALASFPVKQRVIDACAHAALADRVVAARETDLLRAVSAALDCPLPPLSA
jgi:Zn-dependent protease with chaperone function